MNITITGGPLTRERQLADIRWSVENMRDTEYSKRALADVATLLTIVDELKAPIQSFDVPLLDPNAEAMALAVSLHETPTCVTCRRRVSTHHDPHGAARPPQFACDGCEPLYRPGYPLVEAPWAARARRLEALLSESENT